MRHLLLAASLVSAVANAQGSSLCHFSSDNAIFDNAVSMGGPNLLLAIQATAPANMVVTRLEVFTGEATGVNTIGLWSHDAGTNMPAINLGTGSWSMSRVNGWQGANVPPTVLLNGQVFWLVWGPINGAQASVEIGGAGGVVPGAQRYRGSFDGGQSWSGGALGFQSHLWKYRIVCGGSPGTYEVFGSSCPGSGRRTPVLGFSGVPTVNQAMSIVINQALPNSVALLSIGSSDTSWLGAPLPLDLTPFGATGCRVLCNVLDFLVSPTDGLGSGSTLLPVPNDVSLVGAAVFNQWWAVDAAANPLSLVFTNGGRGTIGN